MATIYTSDKALNEWRNWLVLSAMLKKVESGEMTEAEALSLPGVQKAIKESK